MCTLYFVTCTVHLLTNTMYLVTCLYLVLLGDTYGVFGNMFNVLGDMCSVCGDMYNKYNVYNKNSIVYLMTNIILFGLIKGFRGDPKFQIDKRAL